MELSYKDCNAMKGLAVIFIFINNFCHLLPNIPLSMVTIFSFWMYHGVVIFVFLTGYGLVNKYKVLSSNSFYGYLKVHYIELLKFLLPALLLYLCISPFFYGWFNGINIISLVCQLIYVNNLIPTMYSPIVPGVYLYFELTMQLYFIFYFVNGRLRRLLLGSVTCILFSFFSYSHYMMISWIKCNFVGNALPFVGGILLAKFEILVDVEKNVFLYMFLEVCSHALLILAEYSFYIWLFISIPVICFVSFIVNLFSGMIRHDLTFIGSISHTFFVIHPTTRYFVRYFQMKNDWSWQVGALYVLLTLSLSHLFLMYDF